MTTYRTLFQVTTRHDFYADGNCPDFAYIPLGRTTGMLRRNRLLLRSDETGLKVIYQSVPPSQQPIVSLELPLEFAFGMRLNNPAFQLFTDLPQLPDLGPGESGVYPHLPSIPTDGPVKPRIRNLVFCYESDGVGGDVTVTERILAGSSILVDLDTKDPTVRFTLTGDANVVQFPPTVLENDTVKDSNEQTQPRVRGSVPTEGLPAGAYALSYETIEPARDIEAKYYLGAGSGPYFGIILVTLRSQDGEIDPENPRDYEIQFTAREETVRYQVEVVGKEYASKEFDVTDESDVLPPITFSKAHDDTGMPDKKIWDFASQQPLAFQERPSKIFALSLLNEPDNGDNGHNGDNGDGDNGNQMISALPLPSPRTSGQEINITVKSPGNSR